jgi:hypothetical protein
MAPWIGRAIGCVSAVAGLLCFAAPAAAQSVQILSLSDFAFGTISSLSSSPSVAQTVCLYSSLNSYSIRASGSGTGNAFALTSAATADQLNYTVQWAPTGGQSSGTLLVAGQATRFTPPLLNVLCSLPGILAGSASLIITLPSQSLSTVRAGSYSGTLTLLVSPN